MKKVFVCAGMSLAKNEEINRQADRLGTLLAQDNSLVYVQGGSIEGLMGETLKSFLKTSKNVEFFIPNTYYQYDAPKLISLVGKDNFHAMKTEGEAGRLEAIKKCDEIIVLPGGSGTLEELLYCNETMRAGEHSSKVTLVNINGFFNGFLQQIKTNIEQGLSKNTAIKFDIVTDVNQIDLFQDKSSNIDI